jgi:DNA-binding beta-propeller fold protein YncE
MDPVTIVTFTRDGTTAVASDVGLISIALDDRDQSASGTNTAAIEEQIVGTATAWPEDVTGVSQGDRFTWQGRIAVVTFVAPVQYGTVDIRFRLLAIPRGA